MVHLPLRELNSGGQKSDSTLQAIGKQPNNKRFRFAGSSLYGVKIQFLKKERILARLFDKIEPELIEVQQQ